MADLLDELDVPRSQRREDAEAHFALRVESVISYVAEDAASEVRTQLMDEIGNVRLDLEGQLQALVGGA